MSLQFFKNTLTGIEKHMRGIHIQTHTLKSLILIFTLIFSFTPIIFSVALADGISQ